MFSFSNLQDAVDALDTVQYGRIFSEEISCSGARRFIVTSAKFMFGMIINNDINHRCFYEVITEQFECCLYMDLDWNILENGFIDIIKFITEVIDYITVHKKSSNVIVLTSSNDMKYSFHLIWPDIIEDSNKNFKSFIGIMSRLPQFKQLSTSGIVLSVIDPIPYGRRQNFRLLGCRKKKGITALSQHHLTSSAYLSLLSSFFFDKTLVCSARKETSQVDEVLMGKPLRQPKPRRTDTYVAENIIRQVSHHYSKVRLSGYKIYAPTMTILFGTDSPYYCGSNQNQHSSNTIYFLYRRNSLYIEQRCNNVRCRTISRWPRFLLSNIDRNSLSDILLPAEGSTNVAEVSLSLRDLTRIHFESQLISLTRYFCSLYEE